MPFQGNTGFQFYGHGDTCSEFMCDAKLPPEGSPERADWFIKLSTIVCPKHRQEEKESTRSASRAPYDHCAECGYTSYGEPLLPHHHDRRCSKRHER